MNRVSINVDNEACIKTIEAENGVMSVDMCKMLEPCSCSPECC